MNPREQWVTGRACRLLNIQPALSSTLLSAEPRHDLAEIGLNRSAWWTALRQADREYLAVAGRVDWAAVAAVASAHALSGYYSVVAAVEALQEAHDALLGGLSVPRTTTGDRTFGVFDWMPVLRAAQDTHGVDAAGLQAAFVMGTKTLTRATTRMIPLPV